MASPIKELNFKFHIILTNLHSNLNIYLWPLASVLDSTPLELPIIATLHKRSRIETEFDSSSCL